MGSTRKALVRRPTNYPTVGERQLPHLAERSEDSSTSPHVRAHVTCPPAEETPKGVSDAARRRPVGRTQEAAPPKLDLDTLVALASRLKQRERQQLLDLLALDNSLTREASQSRDLEMWSESVRGALDETIGAQGGQGYGSMLVKRQMGATPAWRPVEEFMRSSRLLEMTVPERLLAYRLLARLLVDYADDVGRDVGAPLSLRLVSSCADKLAGVFDQAFPGYVAAGLAPVVARQMQGRPA